MRDNAMVHRHANRETAFLSRLFHFSNTFLTRRVNPSLEVPSPSPRIIETESYTPADRRRYFTFPDALKTSAESLGFSRIKRDAAGFPSVKKFIRPLNGTGSVRESRTKDLRPKRHPTQRVDPSMKSSNTTLNAVTFASSKNYVILRWKVYSTFRVEVKFRTLEVNCLLLFGTSGQINRDFIALELYEGHFRVCYDAGGGTVVIQNPLRQSLSDGKWHSVKVARNSLNVVDVLVDGHGGSHRWEDGAGLVVPQWLHFTRSGDSTSSSPLSSLPTSQTEKTSLYLDLSTENEIYFGGVTRSLIEEKILPKVVKSGGRGFHGCLSPPVFNGIPVELFLGTFTTNDHGRQDGSTDEFMERGILPGCREPSQSCLHGNPCHNGGECIQEWSSHRCDCSMTSYTGASCQKVGLSYEFGNNGKGVMTYRFPKGDWPDSKQDKIAFGIQTSQKKGTILKIESGSGSDFIEIFLKNGRLLALYNVGKTNNLLPGSDVTVSDSKYHVVRFVRSGANATLQSDDGKVARFNAIGDQRTVFNHQSIIRIGGRRTTSAGKVRKSFKGILRGLVVNKLDIFEMTAANLTSITIEGTGIKAVKHDRTESQVSQQINGSTSRKDFVSFEGDNSDSSGLSENDLIDDDDDEDYNKIIIPRNASAFQNHPMAPSVTFASSSATTDAISSDSEFTEAKVIHGDPIVSVQYNESNVLRPENDSTGDDQHQGSSARPNNVDDDRQMSNGKNGASLLYSVRTSAQTTLSSIIPEGFSSASHKSISLASATPTTSEPLVFQFILTRLANVLPGWSLILAVCLGSAVVIFLLVLVAVAIKRYASGRNRGSYTVDSGGPVPSSFCYRHKRCSGKGVCSGDRNVNRRCDKFQEGKNNGLISSGSFQLKQQTCCEFDSVIERKLDAMTVSDSFQWKGRRRRMVLRAWLWCRGRDSGPSDSNNERSLLFNYKCCSNTNYNESLDNICPYCGYRRRSSGPMSDAGSERCSCNMEQTEEEKASTRTTNLWHETDKYPVASCYTTSRVPPPPPPLAVPSSEVTSYIFNTASPSRHNCQDSPARMNDCRSSSLTTSWLGQRFESSAKVETAPASLPRDSEFKPGSKNRRGFLKKNTLKAKSTFNSSAPTNREWYV